MSGSVLDEDGRPIPNTLIEVWQANAAGRYLHDARRRIRRRSIRTSSARAAPSPMRMAITAS